MLTQTQYSNFKFVGRLDKIKTFYQGLKAVGFEEIGRFQINENGLRITIEQGKTIQANLFVSSNCFCEFYVDGVVNFGLNMNIITKSLGIFKAVDCSMKMFYKGDGAPLIINLEPHTEDNISTECSIKTSHYHTPMEFKLDDNSPSLNMIFTRGRELSEIVHGFDKSAEAIELTLSPQPPYFKVATIGVMQAEMNVEVAKSSEMILLFKCRDTTISRYQYSHIRTMFKAFSVAKKVAIKTDADGLLETHFMIHQTDEHAEVYIQFFMGPLVDL